MRTFKDSEGREHVVRVDVAAVMRVRASTKVDLLTILDPAKEDGKSVLERLGADPVFLCEVLHAVIEPKMEPSEFFARFSGNSIADAADALLGEMVDFFPNGQQRQALRRVLATAKRAHSLLMGRLDAVLPEAEIEATAAKVADQVVAAVPHGGPSGSAPGSLDSTQAPSPSGSSSS